VELTDYNNLGILENHNFSNKRSDYLRGSLAGVIVKAFASIRTKRGGRRMKKFFGQTKVFVCFVILFFILGCASAFMKGGSLVKAGYQTKKVIVSYRAEGVVPQGVKYLLIETETGQAIFEKSPDGSGALFQTRWRDDKGDHFAGWVATSHGYEFIVPVDRAKEAKKFVYPAKTYTIKEIGGILRPVPLNPTEPVARLIPE